MSINSPLIRLKRQLDIMLSRAEADAKAWERDDAIRASLLAALREVLDNPSYRTMNEARAAIAEAEGK
jgi:hypothetical protein